MLFFLNQRLEEVCKWHGFQIRASEIGGEFMMLKEWDKLS